ncbi:hypothetical protein MSG28_007494 [Choristoneura fumiferana]|uniref:Uncharacterized protein n=1 Tax=Choristoneura fumiferana TaxID=7141 RepID=A0ACC0JXD1_CHOFU|nr:hypothetical protein MSG28_007494 [Choristoneura fumiferana]
MITSVALLFLFGTTISSTQFISKLSPLPYEIAAIPNTQSSGCPTSSELAPLICKLIQQNIDLYFKPKLIVSSTYIPPIHVEKCDTPQLQMDIELPTLVPETKPLVIPQPPELPPMTIPQFPVPVIIEEPPKSDEPCESSDVSQGSAVNNPVTPAHSPMELPILPQIAEQPKPVEPEIYYTLMEIPQPPELPAFTMPDLPVIVEPAQSIISAPCPESTPKPIPIPAAPELSPASLPKFPIYFDIPSGPVLPPTEMNLPEIDSNFVEYEPISVPQPPELPAFVMPELPVLVVEQEQSTVVEPCLEDKREPIVPIQEYIQPVVAIPQPPELPDFVMPDLPVQVIEQNQPIVNEPCLEDMPAPVVPIQEDFQPLVVIPQPPELPEFIMPELPVVQVMEQKQPTVAEPCLEDKPAYVLPIPDYIPSMQAIPQPPELLEFVMPELPVVQVIEQKPPTAAEPCLEDKPAYELPVPEYIPSIQAIPQPPELPEFVMPELPVVQVIEQKQPTAEGPCLEDKPVPVLPIQEYIQPMVVFPQPPELPEFVMPELPVVQVIEQKQRTAEEPCLEDNPTPVVPIQEYIQPVQVIPQPPELKAFVMPEFPVHEMEQDLPVAPTPCLEDHLAPIVTIPQYIQSLPTIPAAPELPPVNLPEFPVHVEIPTGPVLPDMHILSPPKEPCATEELEVPQLEPISIPKAPKLPEFIVPNFPLKMTIAEPAMPQPTFANEPCVSYGKPVIPVTTMHEHNPFFEKHYPSYVFVNNKKFQEPNKFLVPSKSIVPQFFPAMTEYIIPNIASDRFRSLQNIDVLPPSVSPCP